MFGEWLPDFPEFMNPGTVEARNVIPIPGGYGPQLSMTPVGETVAGACHGARLMFKPGGTDVIVGAAGSVLFKDDQRTITGTGGQALPAGGDGYDFCQFNDFVIATNLNNAPKYLTDIDTATTWVTLSNAPKAKFCARVEDFVMFGCIEGHSNRIQWSPFNAPAGTWGAYRLTQAGYADLPRNLGAVQRIVGGRYPMVMQERGISRMEYVGPPSVWRATEIDQATGCLAPFSVVTVGFTTYYLSQEGFKATDGNSFTDIGAGRVDKWFFETASAANIRETHGTIDFENRCIVWAFKTGEAFNRLLRYSWRENRWSYSVISVSRLVEAVADGFTLEQIGALYPAIEDVPFSLDDPRWIGRNRVLAAFIDAGANTGLNHALGPALAALIEGPEFQAVPGSREMVTGGRLLGQGGELWQLATVAIQNDRSQIRSAYSSAQAGG